MIRAAKKEDYQQIMSLYSLFVEEDRYSNGNADSFTKVLKSPSNFTYVAEINSKIIGFASFSIRDVIRYPKPIAELDELFVSGDYRKQGIGRDLMKTVEHKAEGLKCQRLFIESQYKHKLAHKFYESLGYKNYGYHFIKDL